MSIKMIKGDTKAELKKKVFTAKFRGQLEDEADFQRQEKGSTKFCQAMKREQYFFCWNNSLIELATTISYAIKEGAADLIGEIIVVENESSTQYYQLMKAKE